MKLITIIFIFAFGLFLYYAFFKNNITRELRQLNNQTPDKLYLKKISGIISRGDGRLIYKKKTVLNPYRLTYFACPKDSDLHNTTQLGVNKCSDNTNEMIVDNDVWNFYYDKDISQGKIMSNETLSRDRKLVLKPAGFQQCLDILDKNKSKKQISIINPDNQSCATFGGSTKLPYVELGQDKKKQFNWSLELSENGKDYYIKSEEKNTKGLYLVIGDKSRLNNGKIKIDRDFPMLVPKDSISNLNCKMLKFIPQ